MAWKRYICAIFILLLAFTLHTMIGFHLKLQSTELNLFHVESAPWLRGKIGMVIAIILIVVVLWKDFKSLTLCLKRIVWDIPVYYLVKVLLAVEEKIFDAIFESLGERRVFQLMFYFMERSGLVQIPEE